MTIKSLNSPQPEEISLGQLSIQPGIEGLLFTVRLVKSSDPFQQYAVALPSFEVNGQKRTDFYFEAQTQARLTKHATQEVTLHYRSQIHPQLELLVVVQGYATSPLLRFRYILGAPIPVTLTKSSGSDAICYFTLALPDKVASTLTEIQLSQFNTLVHSYQPYQQSHSVAQLADDFNFNGPLALFHSGEAGPALLVAYEHGAEQPQSFLEFRLNKKESVSMLARQGNYYAGQPLDAFRKWELIWFELGLTDKGGTAELIRAYRCFLLDDICEDTASRQPYLFYNTWNYQERNCYFNKKRYLESMNNARIMAEIEVAHRLGLEIFVIDTGWYTKTGDWEVALERFPDKLEAIRHKLVQYNMRLGLWFNPTVAALTSTIYDAHPEYAMTTDDKPTWQDWVWETEESIGMCLVSDYAAYFLEKLSWLHRTLGVSYFKWDGVSQWGCNSPLHHHGTQLNSVSERGECYAYAMGRALIQIVETLTRQCPGVIVDFDITEGGRFMGLGFLAVGKYFLVNNGPYFSDFDLPPTTKIEPATINAFFYPGPARSRIARQGLKYDFIIPSILFLTHYFPDGPELSQRNALAALMLGGNGLWGDLLSLSEADTEFLANHLAKYKQLAKVVTRATLLASGFPSSSPEIYEKLDPLQGQGLVIFFTVAPGEFVYTTQPFATGVECQIDGADAWEWLSSANDRRVKIKVKLERNEARIVYFLRS